MEIAVCLRGQSNFTRAGYEFFKKSYIDRFPNANFKFFIHTWNFVNTRTLDLNVKEWNVKQKNNFYIENNYIDVWKPVNYKISSGADLSNILLEIFNQLKKQKFFNSWFYKEYLPYLKTMQQGFSALRFPIVLDPIYNELTIQDLDKNTNINNTFLKEFIYAHYLMGQYYSAIKSTHLLREYAQKNNYKPDLVINTRPDCATILCENLNYIIQDYKEKNKWHENPILTYNICSPKASIFVTDFIFLANYNSMLEYLGNSPKEIFLDLFINRKIDALKIINSSIYRSHFIWTQLSNKVTFVKTNSIERLAVFRDNEDNYINILSANKNIYEICQYIRNIDIDFEKKSMAQLANIKNLENTVLKENPNILIDIFKFFYS